MLYEKMQSTIELIEDVCDNKKIFNNNKNTANKNTIFFDSFEKLSPYIKSYVLAKKNFNFALNEEMTTLLQYLMSYSKKAFDSKKVVDPNSFMKKSQSFIRLIDNGWNDFFEIKNSEMIDELNIIALVYPYPSKVRNCIKAFNDCKKLPLTQEKINEYENAKKSTENIISEIRFDKEIKEFLIKVRDKKATFADISPSILEWIKSENISEKITLNIKNVV